MAVGICECMSERERERQREGTSAVRIDLTIEIDLKFIFMEGTDPVSALTVKSHTVKSSSKSLSTAPLNPNGWHPELYKVYESDIYWPIPRRNAGW